MKYIELMVNNEIKSRMVSLNIVNAVHIKEMHFHDIFCCCFKAWKIQFYETQSMAYYY